MAELRRFEGIDAGWRKEWRWRLRKPDFDSIRDEPEFHAMVAEIRDDMAAQLARVREMERRGELVFPPGLPTPGTHASGSSPADSPTAPEPAPALRVQPPQPRPQNGGSCCWKGVSPTRKAALPRGVASPTPTSDSP